MPITVITSPDERSLENEIMRLMKERSPLSENGALALVPDQSTFSEEERLIGFFGVSGLGNPEVLSFSRLFYKLRASFPSGRKRLTAPAREMAVMHALSGIDKDDFRLFRGVIKKRDLTSTVSTLITGFKRYGVTADKLRAAEDKLEDAMPLKGKIHDCLLALESYNALLDKGLFCDADDDMQELKRMLSLPECRFFEGKTVCIRHFSDLNLLQRQCVALIAQRADNVFVAVCHAERPEFATTGKLIEGLRRAAYEYGLDFNKYELTGASARPLPLRFLADNYYEGSARFKGDPAPHINLHTSKNPFEEVRRVAATIARLVRKGRRYRDITVVARDLSTYSDYIKRVFPIYSIPVFVDAKRPLSGHSAAQFLLSAMELAIHGFSHENVFSFAKNPFAPHGGRCGRLEDYCIEAGVRSWNWSEDFTFIRGAYSSVDYGRGEAREDLSDINERRRELWELIDPLRVCLSESRSGTLYARGIYDFMLAADLPSSAKGAAMEQEKQGDLRGAAETRQVYNLLIDILDDICTVFGDSEITPEEFYDAVKTACSAVQIGVVPPMADSVIYGDIERMKGGSDDIVFLLGLCEDVFPRSFQNNSIFTEAEAGLLTEDYGIELPPGVSEKTENERFLVYEALSSAKEQLYLSHPISASDGGNYRPGPVVKQVRLMFPELKETEDITDPQGEYLCATKAAAFLELGTALGERREGKFWRMLYSLLLKDPTYGPKLIKLTRDMRSDAALTEPLDGELLKKVLGGDLALSPSSLETYAACPFSYFAQNILRLKDITPMNINPADSGNLLHNIIDGFCGYVMREKGGDWKAVTDEYTDAAFSRVCAEIRLGLSRQIAADPRFGFSIERIERMARKCIEEIRAQIEDELFVPTGNEVIIDEGGRIPPTKITLPDGRTARFRGRIDRADVRKGVKIEENGQLKIVDLVRIIDYKSSGKEISFSKILNGLQLQLFAYMGSYLEAEENSRPAAVLYFNLTEVPTVAKLGSDSSEKNDRLTGVAVAGRMAERKNVAEIEADEMNTVLSYVKRSIKRIAARVYDGEVPVSPIKDGQHTRCEYCPYGGVCKISGDDRLREIPANSREALVEMREALENDNDVKEVTGNEV
ncbi:MAG: PD-(D/E)XK nuclease family protein [Oscillospiraceae bacterium]|nr:PD-(D/E)XK nuclease family protein [Oscillospiraceae bacterium]